MKLGVPLTPTGVNELVGLPMGLVARSGREGFVEARGLIAVGEGVKVVGPDPPFCCKERRRC